jgi:hypothetical protein
MRCAFKYVRNETHCYVCTVCGAEIKDESMPQKAKEFPALFCMNPTAGQRLLRWSIDHMPGRHTAT